MENLRFNLFDIKYTYKGTSRTGPSDLKLGSGSSMITRQLIFNINIFLMYTNIDS